MTTLILFDNDGVLVDSEPLGNLALLTTMADYGLTLDMAWCYTHTLGRRPPETGALIEQTFGVTLPTNWQEAYEGHSLGLFNTLQAMPGAHSLLEALQQRGQRFGVATSSTLPKTRKKYHVTGLESLIDPATITTGEEVANGKPAPDIFLRAAAKAGVAPADCLVLEDSVAGVEAAVAAGMKVYGFLGGSHIPYLPNHAATLQQAGAAGVIDALSEVVGLLEAAEKQSKSL